MSNYNESEVSKLVDKANEALFNLHRFMEMNIQTNDWREVYGLRIRLLDVNSRLCHTWSRFKAEAPHE